MLGQLLLLKMRAFDPTSPTTSPSAQQRRARWLKLLHEWHWVSAAVSLLAMLLFTLTGFTLNHAGDIEGKPVVQNLQAQVPEAVLAGVEVPQDPAAPLPLALQVWVRQTWDVRTAGRAVEWSGTEAYVSLPRPGGDAWLRVDVASGEAEYESTDRGWIAYFNDLHKGRNTGDIWRWFIDIFALACLIFTVTGLWLLHMHARSRILTWPLVGLGVVLPALLALLWMQH